MTRIPIGKVTALLIVLNVLVWLAGLLGDWAVLFQSEGGFWSARINATYFGADNPFPVDYDWAVPAWLTPVTSAFLHGGLFHLAMNMLILFYCGRLVERAIGSERFALLYTIGIIASAALHYIVEPEALVPVVGASGAISAVLAFYFLLFTRKRPAAIGPLSPLIVHMIWLGVAWIGINLLAGFAFAASTFGIAIYAHIGGFLAGLFVFVPMVSSLHRADPPVSRR